MRSQSKAIASIKKRMNALNKFVAKTFFRLTFILNHFIYLIIACICLVYSKHVFGKNYAFYTSLLFAIISSALGIYELLASEGLSRFNGRLHRCLYILSRLFMLFAIPLIIVALFYIFKRQLQGKIGVRNIKTVYNLGIKHWGFNEVRCIFGFFVCIYCIVNTISKWKSHYSSLDIYNNSLADFKVSNFSILDTPRRRIENEESISLLAIILNLHTFIWGLGSDISCFTKLCTFVLQLLVHKFLPSDHKLITILPIFTFIVILSIYTDLENVSKSIFKFFNSREVAEKLLNSEIGSS